MQNEFEKQVREKMEELSFSPSAPVWQKVEARIQKKKEQRRIFFFLIPVFLLAGWWMLWQWNGHEKKADASNIHSNATVKFNGHSKEIKTDHLSVENFHENKSDDKISIVNNDAGINQSTDSQKNIQLHSPSLAVNRNVKEIKNIGIDQALKNRVEEDQTMISAYKENSFRRSPENARIELHLLQQPLIIILPDAKAANRFIVFPDSNKIAQTHTARKKWQGNYTIEIGRSYYGNSLNMDKSYTNLASVPATASSPNPPSAINKGFSFAFGAGVKRKLSPKINFNADLLYRYNSTVMRTGVRQDSIILTASGNVRSYYANANTNKYTNRFHTIEIPLSIEYQPAAHVPLQLTGGISYGYLFATNALRYDAGANVYYRSKKEFFHSVLNIFSSVQYRFQLGKKIQMQTGPQFSYNAIATERYYNSSTPHLYFFGLSSNIIF